MTDKTQTYPVNPNAVQIVLRLARSAPLPNTDVAEEAIVAQKEVLAYFQKLFNSTPEPVNEAAPRNPE